MQLIPGVPETVGYILAIGGFGGVAVVALWDHLPKKWLPPQYIPLPVAALQTSKALRGTKLREYAEKFENSSELDQLGYIASYLSHEYSVFTKNQFGEWENHGKEYITLDGGETVQGLDGAPHVQSSSVKHFVKAVKNGNWKAS